MTCQEILNDDKRVIINRVKALVLVSIFGGLALTSKADSLPRNKAQIERAV